MAVAALAATACTLNGKPVGWPGSSSGGGRAGAGATPDGSAGGAAPTAATEPGKVPAWCDVEGVEALDPLAIDHTLASTEPNRALVDLAGHFCDPHHEALDRWSELEAARVAWSRRLQMSDADWRDAVEWALRPQIERNAPSPTVDPKRALSSLDGFEQYALIASSYADKTYLTDALDTRLTEIGRMAYVEACLGQREVGAWAICHPDVQAFDVTAIVAELRAATARSGYERIMIRLRAFELAPLVAERIAAVDALIAADPGYQTLFGTAATVRAAWATRGKTDAYRELALEMDDARRSNSRKAFAGCAERSGKAFADAVGTIPAKRFAGLLDEQDRRFPDKAVSVLLDDPDAYLAAGALVICAQGESAKLDYLQRTIAEELRFRPGHRGPRTATHSALLDAAITLDDRDARIAFPEIEREWLPRATGSSGGGQGVVASVERGGDTSVIGFAKEMATYQECTRWKTSNRVDRIDGDGRVHYESSCVATRKKKHDKASRPQTVDSRYLAGVKAKAYVTVVESVVTGVWASQGDATPVAVFGVLVK